MYDDNNIFAKILRNEIPCNKVYEDNYTLIFHDIQPSAPIHLLAIPKGKFKSFNDFIVKASQEHITSYFKSIQNITNNQKILDSGYRLITNHGNHGMQTVEHFHVHILGGKLLGPLISGDKFHT